MRKYSHLLYLARSKGLSISNKRWIQTGDFIRSHHLHNRLQSPPHPPLPFPFSFSHHFSTNLHHYSQTSTLHSSELSNHVDDYPILDYQVTVKDSVFISATHAPAHELWIPLSNLDLLLPPLAAGIFFCYNKKNMSTDAVVTSLKNSLATVLSTYYPLAGEIVPNRNGEPEVVCNNNGVEFVVAHADVDLQSIDFHHPDETVKGKLVPELNRGVLVVQVTELNCGAIILACAFDHRVSDAQSFNTFMTAWAQIARFNKLSNIPSFRSSVLSPRRPPRHDTTFDDMYIPVSSLPPPPPYNEDPLCSRFYYISAESIKHLQSQASATKLQSFTAYIWKLIAQKGDTSDASKTTRVGVITSARKLLTANSEKESSYLNNHFGNMLSIPYGKESNQNLKEMTLGEVANKVNEFVNKAANEEHFRGLIDWVELHRPEPGVARIYFKVEETDGDAIVVSAGHGLQLDNIQFGWGEPQLGSYHFPWGGQTGYITTTPSGKNNGDWVVYAHLKQDHLDLIDSKASHIFKPLTQSYLNFH